MPVINTTPFNIPSGTGSPASGPGELWTTDNFDDETLWTLPTSSNTYNVIEDGQLKLWIQNNFASLGLATSKYQLVENVDFDFTIVPSFGIINNGPATFTINAPDMQYRLQNFDVFSDTRLTVTVGSASSLEQVDGIQAFDNPKSVRFKRTGTQGQIFYDGVLKITDTLNASSPASIQFVLNSTDISDLFQSCRWYGDRIQVASGRIYPA